MARKLATFLKSLHGPKPSANDDDSTSEDESSTSEIEKEKKELEKVKTDTKASNPHGPLERTMTGRHTKDSNESLQERFHLPTNEVRRF